MARTFGRIVATVLLGWASVLHAAEPPNDGAARETRPPLLLSFVGDVMHHEENAVMLDYDRLYDSVRPLLQIDDLSFANIEFPVDPTREPTGYPTFNGTGAYLEAVLRAGVDVLALANNHSFDLGPTGVSATQAVVSELSARTDVLSNGLRPVSWRPIRPTLIVHRGWRIGFVSITSISNVRGSAPYVHLVDYSDSPVREDFLARVRRWRDEYDLLIIGVHAGDEYLALPEADKVRFLRDLSDAGAHIVWAHHSHVLQPWERRNGGVVLHSTGNFVSAQRRHQNPVSVLGRWAPTGDTAVYQVRVTNESDGVTARVAAAPLFTMHDDPRHGLVLRSFDEVLTADLPLAWRAFYFARFPIMRGSLADEAAGALSETPEP